MRGAPPRATARRFRDGRRVRLGDAVGGVRRFERQGFEAVEHALVGPPAEPGGKIGPAPPGNSASASSGAIPSRRAAASPRNAARDQPSKATSGNIASISAAALGFSERAFHTQCVSVRKAARSTGWRCASSRKNMWRGSAIRCG